MSPRELPVLAFTPPVAAPEPRAAARPEDLRVSEFRPEEQALPRFWIWTLGCQMNRSDSEEMAGRLLAAGCAEAPSMDGADLIVINTCAIREAAEAKVIGRQGALANLKAANPAVRVVLTGCAVRERDRAGLAKRFPAVDLFLRPDEEPEIVDRLGPCERAGAGRTLGADGGNHAPEGGRGLGGGPPGGVACGGRRGGGGPPGERLRRLAPDHLWLRQDVHLLHRPVLAGARAEPAVRRDRGRGAGAGGGRATAR